MWDIELFVKLFKLLVDKDTEKSIIQNAIKFYDNKHIKAKLNKLLDFTPVISGVFYIHNIDGKVVYLGKGKNIKLELNKLFLKTTKRAIKIQNRAFSVTFDKSGNRSS